ncbi:MAG TPA: DoxX family membrane protein [Polyangiaceae bacterium]|jgi:thiosulfate dehydrogenase [quinone] large subunit|nr:DoxX family membrane protein [Polyangiaceae bacterium]
MTRHTDAQLAYALFRFSFGVNMAMHGASRILSGVGQFASKTMSDFTHTVLPSAIVWPFAVTLPFVELAVGVLLLLGLFTRIGLVVGSLVMAGLAFGTALRGDWGVLGTQLVYSLVYYVLLTRLSDNSMSVDARLKTAGRPTVARDG